MYDDPIYMMWLFVVSESLGDNSSDSLLYFPWESPAGSVSYISEKWGQKMKRRTIKCVWMRTKQSVALDTGWTGHFDESRTQCRYNAGPESQTVAQHYTSNVSVYLVTRHSGDYGHRVTHGHKPGGVNIDTVVWWGMLIFLAQCRIIIGDIDPALNQY